VNGNGATVGVLGGDGMVLKFEDTRYLDTFEVCLRVDTSLNISSIFNVADFGASTASYDFIYPLGLTSIRVEYNRDAEFLCSFVSYLNISNDRSDSIRLFPIYRVDGYEGVTDSTVSYKTKCFMYTLGVCYCVLFFTFLFCIVSFEFIIINEVFIYFLLFCR
jgi:hypothetical protein